MSAITATAITVNANDDEHDMLSPTNDFVGYNEWAARTLGVTIATDFVYEEQPDGDRGVFIAEDIAPHTDVFTIPRDAMLTVRSIHTMPSLARLASLPFFQHCDVDSEDDQLALALLFEKHVTRTASTWHQHIALLPTTYDNVLYFDEDAHKRLRGSNVFLIAQEMEQKVTADYAALETSVLAPLFDALLTAADASTTTLTHAALTQSFSLAQYKWALSTIWSRFVSLDVVDRNSNTDERDAAVDASSFDTFFGLARVKAMVPVFDMLNHDPDAQMAHYYDCDSNTFKLVSRQRWSAGAQLCINYGALSNQRLLALYGFVIESNAFDALDVWVPMDVERTQFYDAKAALLTANGLDHETTPFELTCVVDDSDNSDSESESEDDDDSSDDVRDETLNELLLIAVRIQEITCDSLGALERLAARALNGEVLSVANERATLTRLIYTLQHLLRAFDDTDDDKEDDLAAVDGAASFAKDDALLASLAVEIQHASETSKHDVVRRKRQERMAIVVRRSDKAILLATIEQLQWKLLAVLSPAASASAAP